ncbi:MAG: hypothetical protein ACRD0K_00590 [Egibacteraceae bacterium]
MTITMRLRVVILFGGRSSQHRSRLSARSLLFATDRKAASSRPVGSPTDGW